MSEVSLTVRLKDMFSRALGGLSGGIKRFASGITSALQASWGGFDKLRNAVTSLVGAYQAEAAAGAKLKAAQEATGYATGFTTNELKKQANQLEVNTGVANEAIMSTQAMLAGFGKISGENFTRATTAALDMAAALKKAGADTADVEAKSLALGKALADPAQGLAALTKAGMLFTEGEKEQIIALQEAGRLQEAQGIILGKLEERFGGTAAKVNESTAGMSGFKTAVDDLRKRMGGLIADNAAFGDIVKWLTGVVRDFTESGDIELWAVRAKTTIGELIEAVKTLSGWLTTVNQNLQDAAGYKSSVYEKRYGMNREEAQNAESTIRGAGFFGRIRMGANVLGARLGGVNSTEALRIAIAMENERTGKMADQVAEIKARKAAEEAAEDVVERAAMAAAAAERERLAQVTTRTTKEETATETQKAGATEVLAVAKEELAVAEERLAVAEEETEVERARAALRQTSMGGAMAGESTAANLAGYDLNAGAIRPAATNTGLGVSLAAQAEADRISKIVKAIRGDGDGGESIAQLKLIATHTGTIAGELIGRTSMG